MPVLRSDLVSDGTATVKGLPTPSASGDAAPKGYVDGLSYTVTAVASNATPSYAVTTPLTCLDITALAVAITSLTSGQTGAPQNFWRLIMRIKDTGVARALSFGALFEARGVALPTTTTAGKVLTLGFLYDTTSLKWGCVASVVES